jgi:hypothetical protein
MLIISKLILLIVKPHVGNITLFLPVQLEEIRLFICLLSLYWFFLTYHYGSFLYHLLYKSDKKAIKL